MSKIIIASNTDYGYYKSHHDDWIESVLKNKNDSMHASLFTVGFEIIDNRSERSGLSFVQIPENCINFSKMSSSQSAEPTRRRPGFICLETGEFVMFTDFDDDDILVLCDYDVTMQRSMSDEEILLLSSLGKYDFAANRDDYSGLHNLGWFFKRFCSDEKLFQDVDKSWIQYNTGVQAGRVSAWKNIFSMWKENANIVKKAIPQHFAFQLFFSYTLQKNNILKEMPVTFHNADWFRNTPASIRNNQLVVIDEPVLFFHHKFKVRPSF